MPISRYAEDEPSIISPAYVMFEITSNDILPEYLELWTQRAEFDREADFYAVGGVRGNMTWEELQGMSLIVPPIKEQQVIVARHQAIDDRIDALRKLNDKLAAFADFLYSTMFADDCFDDTWTDGAVGDVIQLQRGHDLPRQNMNNGPYPVVGSTDVIGHHDAFTTKAPVIALGRSGNIGNPRMYQCDCWVHNTALYVKQFINADPLWAFYMLKHLNYDSFVGGSAVPTLNRNNVHAFSLKIPPKELQQEFSKQAAPILVHVGYVNAETAVLMSLKSALLSNLGSIR